uniref:Cadherin domain-containing protein n=1 Tax=Cynoglossus semilaevis TaxID=244447 RepID=A0A3P8WKU3_CYNSE
IQRLQTVVFLATVASSLTLAAADLAVVEGEKPGELVFVRNSHSVLFRQKREWIWNKLFVEEEKPTPTAYKIGQVKVDGRRYEISGEGANSIFTVDLEGDLFVTKTLDREEKNSYRLTAKMFDRNNMLIERSGEFIVHVTDINDNLPVFAKTFNGSVMERSSPGESL